MYLIQFGISIRIPHICVFFKESLRLISSLECFYHHKAFSIKHIIHSDSIADVLQFLLNILESMITLAKQHIRVVSTSSREISNANFREYLPLEVFTWVIFATRCNILVANYSLIDDTEVANNLLSQLFKRSHKFCREGLKASVIKLNTNREIIYTFNIKPR